MILTYLYIEQKIILILKPDSSNSNYFYYGKHFIYDAERFWPFSLGPLLRKLYMYTFYLKKKTVKQNTLINTQKFCKK